MAIPRTKDVFLNNTAYTTNTQAAAIDLQVEGQMGHHTIFANMFANTTYVSRNVVCILVQAPKGFSYFPDASKYIGALKVLVEMHARQIEGLQAGVKAEFVENQIDGSGQIQEDISNTTRDRSTPTFTWLEKPGKPIRWFLEAWITGLGMDPITKIPNVITLNASSKPTDMLGDVTGATMLFFEADPTFTTVNEAWLCTNMFPEGTGDVVGRRDLTAAGQNQEIQVRFTAVTQHGFGVMSMAQKVLNSMNMEGTNPNLQEAFISSIAADVSAITSGYAESVANMPSTSI